MRSFRIFAAFAFFTAPLLAGSVAGAQQDQTQSGSGDPVADAARKAREEKKTAPKPRKVFTNDDITPKPVAEQPAPAPASSATTTETATETATSAKTTDDSSGKSEKKEDISPEAVWRKRFATQRRKIADAEQELDVLEREAEKANLQYYSDPQKALKEQLTRNEVNEKNDKIAAKKKDLADLKQQLSDLEDQLRAAGGDSGWAR